MDVSEVLTDGMSRSLEVAEQVLDGLVAADANRQPAPGCNSITWLVWHLARQQDAQIAHLAGTQEVWLEQGWVDRFALDLPRDSMGYGHSPEEAAKVRVDDTSLLTAYLREVVAASNRYLGTLAPTDLDEVIDTSWTPHVTRGVRLVSIVDDAAQHAGQAAYLRGWLEAAG